MLETSVGFAVEVEADDVVDAGVAEEAALDVEVGVTEDISVIGVVCVVEDVDEGVVDGVDDVGDVTSFTVTVS